MAGVNSISVGSHLLSIGIEWQLCSDRQEARRQLKQRGSGAYLLEETSEGVLLGYPTGNGESSIAAARALAQVAPQCLVFQPVSQEQIWVCAIGNGLPLPGTDRCLSPDVAEQWLQDMLTLRPNTPVIGSHPVASVSLETALAALDRLQLKQARLRSALSRSHWRWLISLGLIIVLLFWMSLSNSAPDLITLEQEYLQSIPAHTPAIMPAENTDDILNEARLRFFHRYDSGETAQQWLNLLRQLPVSAGGYQPHQIICDPIECRVRWRNAAASQDVQLALLPGRADPHSAPGQLTEPETRFNLSPAATRKMEPMATEHSVHFIQDISRELQRRGVRTDISPPGNPVNIQIAGASVPIGAEGKMRLSTANLALAEHAIYLLADHPVTLDRGIFTLAGATMTLQLEGVYVTGP